ncbi:MAG: hypothetical protein EHM34_04605 [Nitrosopumilales archaeon]|nr:MAG: hypothetical protein EHM34_04605 [Nitrosopumilales archaeon]
MYFHKTDLKLYFVSISGMTCTILLIILILPVADIFGTNSTSSDKFNYVFWYYSMLTQTFGAILAITIAFAKHLSDNDEGSRLKNFVLLYITLIVLSIIGLTIGTIPPMNAAPQSTIILSDRFAIMTLESTLLLISPAFACLYELSKISLFPPKH